MRLPELPGQEARTKRALEKGAVGTNQFINALIAIGLIGLLFTFLGIYTIVNYQPPLALIVGVAFLAVPVGFLLVAAPIIREDRKLIRQSGYRGRFRQR